MSDQRPYMPPFNPKGGLTITQIDNGGWTVTAAINDPRSMPRTIAAFSSADDLVTALTSALTGPNPPKLMIEESDSIIQKQALPTMSNSWDLLVASAISKAHAAMAKYPQPNYVITKIAEEAGEVVQAAVHCAEGRESVVNVRAEMTQLIAMLYRLWVEGDAVHGLAPVQPEKEPTP